MLSMNGKVIPYETYGVLRGEMGFLRVSLNYVPFLPASFPGAHPEMGHDVLPLARFYWEVKLLGDKMNPYACGASMGDLPV